MNMLPMITCLPRLTSRNHVVYLSSYHRPLSHGFIMVNLNTGKLPCLRGIVKQKTVARNGNEEIYTVIVGCLTYNPNLLSYTIKSLPDKYLHEFLYCLLKITDYYIKNSCKLLSLNYQLSLDLIRQSRDDKVAIYLNLSTNTNSYTIKLDNTGCYF